MNTILSEHHVSEVEVFPVKPRDGLVAFVSFVFDSAIFVGNVAVYSRPEGNGYRLVYPQKSLPNGKTLNVIHPITKAVGQAITEAVNEKFEELAGKCGKVEIVGRHKKR